MRKILAALILTITIVGISLQPQLAGAQGAIPIVCGQTIVSFAQLPVDHPLETDSVRVSFHPARNIHFVSGTYDDTWKNLNPPPETPFLASRGFVAGWPLTGFNGALNSQGKPWWFGVTVTAPAMLATSGAGFVEHIFIFRFVTVYEAENGDLYDAQCFGETTRIRLIYPYSSTEPPVNALEEENPVDINGTLGNLIWSSSWTPTPTITSTPTKTATPTPTLRPTRPPVVRATGTLAPAVQCSTGNCTPVPTPTRTPTP